MCYALAKVDIDALFYNIILTLIAHGVLAVLAGLHAMVNKRDPKAATGWIAVCILFPFAGPLLYFFFGINRVRTRARTLRPGRGSPALAAPERPVIPPLAPSPGGTPPDTFRELFQISEKVTRRPVAGGNTLEMYEGGEEAYPPMLEAIRGAKRSAYLSTYIFRHDRTGKAFLEELTRASHRGVDVRVLIDGVGEIYSLFRTSAALRRGKVPVARFLPPSLLPPSFSINMRNHRKILTVDGEKAFVGGMNIWDQHVLKGSQDPRRIRDVHFLAAGNVARQLEHTFLEDWNFATGKPSPEEPGVTTGDPWQAVTCRTVVDGPDENLNKLADILVGAIAAAGESVTIVTPYFLPTREMISALNSASLRGVAVTVILPEKNNLPYVHWASRNLLWEILIKGARVFYQPPPFAHTKLFVIDSRYSLVGSANIDPRSLRLNFEIGVEIFDEGFSRNLERYCDEVRGRSRPVTLEEVDGRPLPQKLRDAFFWLFSPYL